MCDRCIKDIEVCWDNVIGKWFGKHQSDLDAPDLLAGYRRPNELQRDALPEPFVGSPYDPGMAVMINLNPGQALPGQRKGGDFFNAVQSTGYSTAAHEWQVAPETTAWWRGRSGWPARLLGEDIAENGKPQLFGMDIFPWHSLEWAGVHWTEEAITWVKDNVLRLAAAAAPKSRLGTELLKKDKTPVVLAVGAAIRDVMKGLNIHPVAVYNEDNRNGDWPIKRNGNPVNRTLALYNVTLVDPHGDKLQFRILVTSAKGSNKTPSAEFDPLIRRIIGLTP